MRTALSTAGLVCLAAGLLAGSAAPSRAAISTLQVVQDTCQNAAKQVEAQTGTPKSLLTAISLAESGRWDDKQKASYSWPWTVTTGGPTTYFASKEEAIEGVKALQAKGVTNIDVGCMQVNLRYHPHAFSSLEDAFDPVTNVGYGARFLTGLQKETNSWPDATARYHSADPKKGGDYRDRVLALWERVTGRKSAELGTVTTYQADTPPEEIKEVTLASVQARFRARLAAEHAAPKNGKAMAQFEKWRQDRAGFGQPRITAGAARVAELRKQHQQDLQAEKMTFEDKRKMQLELWRQTHSSAAFRQ